MTRIWLVADDYGISPSVNGAICDLIAQRRINATSVMVVAPGFGHAQAAKLLDAAKDTSAAIGLHLTLTGPFRPLTSAFTPTENGAFLPLTRTLIATLIGSRMPQLADEIGAQIDAFQATFGRPPDYLDGHQHVHLFPQIRDSVLDVVASAAPSIWVRQCGRARQARSLTDGKGLLLDVLSRGFRARAAKRGIRTNTAFAGTYTYTAGARFADLFAAFLRGMPDGGLIMCHPGVVDDELVRLDPLTNLREQEYAFFKSESFPALLAANNVTLM